MSDDFELLGAPHAARIRESRARADRSCPQHPDFTPGDDDRAADDPIEPADDVAAADTAVDFAHVGHLVGRMRAAFFSGDS